MVAISGHDLLRDDLSFEISVAQTEGIDQSLDFLLLELTGAIRVQLAELPVDFCLIELFIKR